MVAGGYKSKETFPRVFLIIVAVAYFCTREIYVTRYVFVSVLQIVIDFEPKATLSSSSSAEDHLL